MNTKPPEPSPEQIAQWWAEARDVHADNPGLAPIQLARLAYAAGWEARAVVKDSLTAEAPPAEGEVRELVGKLGWIAAQCADIGWPDDSITVARAAALLECQAAPVPVPLRKRWSDRGWPESSDCDAQGRLWCSMGGATWELRQIHSMDTHWLPARALPLPSREATNG